MPITPPSQLSRTASWPSTTRVPTINIQSPHKAESKPASDTRQTKSHLDQDIEDHPESQFLSPLDSDDEDDWPYSDDDDDEEEEEDYWDAGITDFALFDDDRRHTPELLPAKWKDFISSQQSALKRAVQRSSSSHSATAVDTTRPPLPMHVNEDKDDLPGLTPDHSPNLRDDLEDVESPNARSEPMFIVPSYLSGGSKEDYVGSDEDLPLSLFRERLGKPIKRKIHRPGMQYSRTMSGKVHVWRRPSRQIYPVGEDVDAERRAEDDGGR